jgi:hypothetical protein
MLYTLFITIHFSHIVSFEYVHQHILVYIYTNYYAFWYGHTIIK